MERVGGITCHIRRKRVGGIMCHIRREWAGLLTMLVDEHADTDATHVETVEEILN